MSFAARLTRAWVVGLLTAAVLPHASNQEPCPVPNRHCDCDDLISGDVTCSELSDIPSNLPSNVSALDMSDCFLGPFLLQQQVSKLKNGKLVELYLSNNKIKFIQNAAFAMLPELEILDLGGNNIEAISAHTFFGLKKLTTLYFNNANLKRLPRMVFQHTPMLKVVDLESNQLTAVGSQFSGLLELRELYLAENALTEVDGGAFVGTPRLARLSLFGNRLTLPRRSWFESIVANDGYAEVGRRKDADVERPNPWKCCPNAELYFYYVNALSAQLPTHAQLDIRCAWPDNLAGRSLTSLSYEELEATPCAGGNASTTTTTTTTASTTAARRTKESAATRAVALSKPGRQIDVDVIVVRANFLSSLDDAGVALVLLLVAAAVAVIVAGCCYCRNAGKDKKLFVDCCATNTSSPGSANVPPNTRPFRQEYPSFAKMSLTPSAKQESGSDAPPNDSQLSGNGRQQTPNPYVIESDGSEDEIWDIKKLHNKA